MLQHIFTQEATIEHTAMDRHGQQIIDSEEAIGCRFRYITEVAGTSNSEENEAYDAIAWFPAGANLAEGTIFFIDGKHWRIYRLVKARRLTDSTVQFLKAYVKVHTQPNDQHIS